jgi:hypothetical protein
VIIYRGLLKIFQKNLCVFDEQIIMELNMKTTKEKETDILVKKSSDLHVKTNPSLDKFRGEEFEPPKLKKIREKFKNPVIIQR